MMLFLFFGFIIGALDSPPEPDEVWIVALFIIAPGVAALGLLLYLTRHRVIADENGLRWRGAFSGWKNVRWDEVSDFTLVRFKSGSHVVETLLGQLTFDRSDTCVEELAQFIAARATKAPYREWLLPYERENARFELVFTTPLVSGRALLLAWAPITLTILGLLMWLTPRDFALWQSTRETAGWAQAMWVYLAPLALGAACLSLIPTVILAHIISARWLHQIERVIATERGLQLEKSGETLQIAWSELRAVHLFELRTFNTRARFETARGNRELGWRTSLRPIIESYAPAVPIVNESDAAPPIQLASGAQFYSFRTAGLRLMLRTFAAMTMLYVFTPPLMMLGVAPEDAPRDDARFFWILAVPFAAFCGWQWRLYQRGGLVLSEIGIEVRGAWRDRFYRWDEIEERDDKLMIRGSERPIKLWSWTPPVRSDEVRAEIKRRIGQEQPRRSDVAT